MNTAKKIKINYQSKAAYELAMSQPCPRTVNDVYSLGVSLQYCIRAKYMELNGLLPGKDSPILVEQATKQLALKTEIEKQAKYKLNILMGEFYDHGGPLMEDPVSKDLAKDIRPFFQRHISRFLQSLDEIIQQAAQGKITAEGAVSIVNLQIAEMYTAIGRMFRIEEIESAFHDLIEIRQA